MSKIRNTGITVINGTFGTLATLPQQPKFRRLLDIFWPDCVVLIRGVILYGVNIIKTRSMT